MNELLAHPVAALFPLLDQSSERYRRLVTSIERNGLWHPIVLDSLGRVLDGRNRLRACADAKVEPKFVAFSELSLGLNEDGGPVAEDEFAFDQNFARRDLTDDQRVTIYARYGEYIEAGARGAPKGNSNATKSNGNERSPLIPATAKPIAKKKRTELASKAGVSERKAQQALNVARASPELAEKVAAGEVKLRDAAKTVESKKSPPPKQQSGVDVDKQVVAAVRSISKISDELHQSDRTTFFENVILHLGRMK